MSSCKSISDPVFGRSAAVDADGNLSVRVDTVSDPLDTLPTAVESVTTTTATVTTTSAQLVAANAVRRQIEIHNLDAANPVHIRFGAGSATDAYPRIGPGSRYEFPCGIAFTGAIQAIATGASVAVAVVEYNVA